MSGNWSRRLKAYELAKADANSLVGEDCTDAECEFYSDVQWKALCELIVTPAPDIAAFARKVAIFIEEAVGGPTHSAPAKSLFADAMRFEAEALAAL
jgi:hypothetical protein